MEDRGRSEYRLSALTQDARLKSSSESASSLLQSHHITQTQLAPPPPILPSLDAYLDAYRSLMSSHEAMAAQLGGIRPPAAATAPQGMAMPVLPTAAAAAAAASLVSSPYYGISPYSVDLARYGLLSPVYVPPLIGPLLYGGGAAASAGLLADASPDGSSQSFAKSLLEACAAARKADPALATTLAAGRSKLDMQGPKPAPRDPKPAPSDPLPSDRKWNSSSSKVEVAAVPQSAAVVDFSARRCSDVGVKSSVPGVQVLAAHDARKNSSSSSTSLTVHGKTAVVDNSTRSYGQCL